MDRTQNDSIPPVRVGVDPGCPGSDRTVIVGIKNCPNGVMVEAHYDDLDNMFDMLLARQFSRWSKRKQYLYYVRRFISRIPYIKRRIKFSKYEGLNFGVSTGLTTRTYHADDDFKIKYHIHKENDKHGT